MDKAIYTAANSATQILHAQAINSHNLANTNTAGFQADLSVFMSQKLPGDGYATRIMSTAEMKMPHFKAGSISPTGRDLDVAIQDRGFIAIQAPNGTEAYTRTGSLKVTAQGLLVTERGFPVLGNGGAISIPPADSLEIANDGTISIVPSGADSAAITQLDRIKLVNPDIKELHKTSEGLFRPKNGEALEPDSNVRLVSRSLESSNFSPMEGMVKMIELMRQFELNVKVMRAAKENDTTAARIMQIN